MYRRVYGVFCCPESGSGVVSVNRCGLFLPPGRNSESEFGVVSFKVSAEYLYSGDDYLFDADSVFAKHCGKERDAVGRSGSVLYNRVWGLLGNTVSSPL